MENGFDLSDYDQRCLDFAEKYAEKLLAIDVNIEIDTMLDISWDLFSEYFGIEEVGIKKEFVEQHWKEKKSTTTEEPVAELETQED